MAFELRREREFELGLAYVGPTAVLQFEFSFFFPGGADDLAFLLDAALFSIDVLPIIQANYLRYTIESDREPFPDRYRVTITLAGEVEASSGTLGPFTPFAQAHPQVVFAIPPLLVIIAAIGLALIFVVIAWNTFRGGLWGTVFGDTPGKPDPVTLALVLGAIGVGAYMIFGRRKGNA